MVANKVKATPAARKQARDNDVNLAKLVGSGENGRIHLVDILNYLNENKVKISPLAKRIAEDLNIDIEEIVGTGHNGKILKADIEKCTHKNVLLTEDNQQAEVKSKNEIIESKVEEKSIKFNDVEGEYVKLSPMRATVARRMSESYFSAPTFTMNMEVDATNINDLRQKLIECVKEEVGEKLTVTDLIVMAVAKTLQKHPVLNSAWAEDKIFKYKDVNIALAVGLEEGLYVPVIRKANEKSLKEITRESKELARKVTSGKLMPSEQEGNTFTISNVGMYGVLNFTPIINMPSSAILGVGATIDRAVPINGGYETRPIMTLSLTCDHRVVDGTPAAKFLQDLKKILENPYSVLI